MSDPKFPSEFTREAPFNKGFVLSDGGEWSLVDLTDNGGNMIDEQLRVKKIDNHYHIQIGCQETIAHDKKEAMKWLGKMWDEFVAKGE